MVKWSKKCQPWPFWYYPSKMVEILTVTMAKILIFSGYSTFFWPLNMGQISVCHGQNLTPSPFLWSVLRLPIKHLTIESDWEENFHITANLFSSYNHQCQSFPGSTAVRESSNFPTWRNKEQKGSWAGIVYLFTVLGRNENCGHENYIVRCCPTGGIVFRMMPW